MIVTLLSHVSLIPLPPVRSGEQQRDPRGSRGEGGVCPLLRLQGEVEVVRQRAAGAEPGVPGGTAVVPGGGRVPLSRPGEVRRGKF